MDPNASCLDIQRCQICDDGFAELFCVCCDIKLCRMCIGAHIADDPEKHNIIKIIDKYKPIIFPACDMHSQKLCKNYCQQCDLAVCSSCISSESHERHKLLKIKEILKRKKGIIKNDSDELEQEVLPSLERIVKQVESRRKELEETFENVFQNIETQRKTWHQEIDNIVNTLKEEVCVIQKSQMKAQGDYLQRLKELLLDVRLSIQKNKDLLESLEISELLLYECKKSKLKMLPPKLEISAPRFIPKPIEKHVISEQIGFITGFYISKQEGSYQLTSQSSFVSSRNNRGNTFKLN